MKVMRMSRPELLCGILVNSFRLQILVSLNSLHNRLRRSNVLGAIELYPAGPGFPVKRPIRKQAYALL